mgnify:CR=1 FL=1
MHFDQMIICIIPTILLAISIKNKPTHIPNVGAVYLTQFWLFANFERNKFIKASTPQQSLGNLLKILLSDGKFMKNALCIGYGNFFNLGKMITQTSSSGGQLYSNQRHLLYCRISRLYHGNQN